MKKLIVYIGIVTLSLGASFAFAQEDQRDDSKALGIDVSSEAGVSVDDDVEVSADAGIGVEAGDSKGDGESNQEQNMEANMGADEDGDGHMEANAEMKALDEDSDDDVVMMNIEAKRLDKATPMLFNVSGSDEVGIKVRYEGGDDAEEATDLDGDGAVDVVVSNLHVNGVEVRGWDSEKKEAVLARVQQNAEVTSANDFGLSVAAAAISHDEIVDIETDEEATEVSYTTQVKLFGFIPKNVTATAHAEANDEVKVKFPWYAFLAAKGDQSVYTSLALELRAHHDTAMNSVRNMK